MAGTSAACSIEYRIHQQMLGEGSASALAGVCTVGVWGPPGMQDLKQVLVTHPPCDAHNPLSFQPTPLNTPPHTPQPTWCRSWASSGCASSACLRSRVWSSTTRPATPTCQWPPPPVMTSRHCEHGEAGGTGRLGAVQLLASGKGWGLMPESTGPSKQEECSEVCTCLTCAAFRVEVGWHKGSFVAAALRQ
jgi:hypothetical protein